MDARARPGRRRTALLIALLVVALVGAGLAVRSGARLYRRLSGPPVAARQADPAAIAGWMTVPYVARGYGVPGPVVFAALGVPPEENRQRSLDGIADRYGRDRAEVVATVRKVVAAARGPTVGPVLGDQPLKGAGP